MDDAAIEEARVRADNARRDYGRYEKLLAEDAVTRQQYDNARTTFEAAQARYEQLLRARQSTSLAKDQQTRRLDQNEAAILLLLLFLLYDAPIRRELKQMPLWTRLRRDAGRAKSRGASPA